MAQDLEGDLARVRSSDLVFEAEKAILDVLVVVHGGYKLQFHMPMSGNR